MKHLEILENLLYGAMDADNEALDNLLLITALGRIEAQEGETFEESFERTCDDIRSACREMWEKIAFYHTSAYVGSKVGEDMVYDEL